MDRELLEKASIVDHQVSVDGISGICLRFGDWRLPVCAVCPRSMAVNSMKRIVASRRCRKLRWTPGAKRIFHLRHLKSDEPGDGPSFDEAASSLRMTECGKSVPEFW